MAQPSLPHPDPAETLSPAPFPPHVLEAEESFRRLLPGLLRDHPGKWVAFRGPTLVEIADTKVSAFRKCHERGLKVGEVFVWPVAELPEAEFIGPRELS